jgi:hypothetical protein
MIMLLPKFPDFKPLELEDYGFIRNMLWGYTPGISEMTFTNLFIWRGHYGFQWAVYKDWLLIISREGVNSTYALQPVGPSSRKEAAAVLLEWFRDEMNIENPCIERADERCISELGGMENLVIEPLRDHFDYVYRREDLVQLTGSKYRSKRNHINQLLRFYSFDYELLQEKHIDDCLTLQEKWCQMNRCEDDLDLLSEDEAIREILIQYDALHVQGAVIIIEGRVRAFTVGEQLNDDTVVIHIEKADPDIPGLYPLINQQFCKNMWDDAVYINREQDLGIDGLRKAKLSYYPDHFVEKYRIRMM